MPPVTSKSTDKDSPESDQPKPRKRPGRVPVSCAECRRLKLRCDRKVPCETCMKRGCAALCPDGSLITGGKGTRQAVADVEELKKKLDQLQTRSNALESALKALQSAVTDEPHPLLQDFPNVPIVPHSSESPLTDSSNGTSSAGGDEEDALDAFGTLTLGLRGETRFFGQTSRSEYLIHAPEKLTSNDQIRFPRLTKELVDEANKELDVQCRNKEIGVEMMKLLPPLSQAFQLCETFLEYAKYVWYPLPRQHIFDDIISLVYSSWKDSSECNLGSTHKLALMWMIYALATLFDVNTPPYAVEAHEYYLLARLSLRYAPPAHDTTLTAIQTLIYMSQYLEMSDCEPAHTQSHKAWMVIGHAVKLGHSIGLHMSSSKWRLPQEATLQRNRVFWQLFFQDSWLSFGFGRPPTVNMAFVDCEMPMDPETTSSDQDKREVGFHEWTWQYTKLLHSIMASAFGAKSPSYTNVMEFDKKVRDFPIPLSLRVQCGMVESPQPTPALVMQRMLGTLLKETTLLNLHRPYFSQALNDLPQDPLRHRYGPSVMAIYRSAWRIFASARCSWKDAPGVSARLGMLWSYALAGSIVMCLLVIRAPSSNLAKSSLEELDKLCDLFEDAAKQSQIASNNLHVIRRMRKQAHDAMNKMHATEDTVRIHTELDRLGGKTHLICPTNSEPAHCPKHGPSKMSPGAYEGSVQPDIIHPTIMQDMRAFEVENFDIAEQPQFNMDLPPTVFAPGQAVDFSMFSEFDFSPAAVQPHASPSTGSGSSSMGSPDVWGINGHVSGLVNGANGHGQGIGGGMQPGIGIPGRSTMQMGVDMSTLASGPPVLDATWQALVEQLGF